MSDDTLFYFWEVIEYPNQDDYGYTLYSEMDEWLTNINPYEDANLPENSCLAVQGDYMLRYWELYEHADLLDQMEQFNSGDLSNEDVDDIIVELWNFDSFGSCEGFNPGDGPDGPGTDYTLSNYTMELFNADHYYDEGIAENSMPYLYIDNSPGVVVTAEFTDMNSEGQLAGLLSVFIDRNGNGVLDEDDTNTSGVGSVFANTPPNLNQEAILLVDNGPRDMDDAIGRFSGEFSNMDVLKTQGATVFFASIDPNMEQNNVNEVKEVKPLSNEGQRFTAVVVDNNGNPVPGIAFAAISLDGYYNYYYDYYYDYYYNDYYDNDYYYNDYHNMLPNYRLGITDENGELNMGASFEGYDVEFAQLLNQLDRNVAVIGDTSNHTVIFSTDSETGFDFGTISILRLNTLVQGMVYNANEQPLMNGVIDVNYDIMLSDGDG